jgi:ATP-dependent exoDNAse (exonuclease V) beta subunit
MVGELAGEFPNQIIRASAGTGKTFRLSNRYLRLLASGAECQTILATTFTKKGAGEILDRIINRLSDAALDADVAKRLSEELDFVIPQDRAAKILFDLLGNLHRLEVSTLDSFFNKVAKVFALELGLPPTWDIVEEQQINQLQDEAIQSVLRNESVLNLLHMLSKGEASRSVASMVRMTVNNVYDIFRESGPEPWDKLPSVGAFLSAEEMDRLIPRMEAVQCRTKTMTKHWEQMTEHCRNENWSTLIEMRALQRSAQGDYMLGRSKLPADIVDILTTKLIPHCAAYASNRLIQQNHSTRDLLNTFGELLEKRKDETGSLRFDDVTERLQTFVSMWNTERFSFRLDHQIQHLLLDEFQDTSLGQWNVIRPFANAITEKVNDLRSFFCVGDMKQAIFGWRGGVAEIFDLVDDQLPNLEPAAKLTASYRSSQPIIDLVNDVFLKIKQYQCKDDVVNEAIYGWTNWFESHSTERKELPGFVSIEMAADAPEELKRTGIDFIKDNNRNKKLYNKTIRRIKELCRSIPDHHDIGVIVRTNKEVRDLIGRLQAEGVPASEEGGTAITDSAAVELILSAITMADHPGDSVARFHLSHSSLAKRFGLKPETDINQKENSRAARIAANELRSQLIADGYGPTIESLALPLIEKCTEREIGRLQHLVRVAYDSPLSNNQWYLRPIRFVEYVRDEVKASDQGSAQVRVMTIHKAKGLEFDVVVLPMPLQSKGWAGMPPNVVVGRESPTDPIDVATRYAKQEIRNLLPENFQKLFDESRQANVREAMCVMYVALTRAVHAVHVIMSHGAKVDHQSPAGVLFATLFPDKKREEGVMYEHGDPRWFEKTKNENPEPPFDLGDFYLPEKITWNLGRISNEVRSGRGVTHTVPSALEGGDTIQLGAVFEKHDNHESFNRGRLIHGCFQKLTWLDDSIPRKEELEAHLRTIAPTMVSFDRVIEDFYKMVDHRVLKKMLTRSTYSESYLMEFSDPTQVVMEANRLEVRTERGFAVNIGNNLVRGVIDRLVFVFQGDQIVAADLVDFKTDLVCGESLHERIEYYRPQLSTYRKAVSKFANLPLDKISTRLAFVESGQIVNLEIAETTVEDVSKRDSKRNAYHGQQTPSPKSIGGGKTGGKKVESKKTGGKKVEGKNKVESPKTKNTPPAPKSKPSQQQKTFWD